MSFTAQPAEPRGARWRAGVVALIGVFALGLAAVAPVAAAPAVPGPGFTDFVYKPDVDGTGGDDVTSFRNQSKLWFNDGRWWGILFDKGSAPNGTFRIQSLTMATQTWTTSATATQVDNRNRAASDALWDGTNLWVVSSQDHGRNWSPNGDVRLFKYTYSSATKTYSPVDLNPSPTLTYKVLATSGADPGGTPLPKAPGRDAATIAKAPDGSLWVSWMQQIDPTLAKPSPANVMVTHGNAAGTSWSAPFVLPVEGTAPTTDDMVAITSVGTTASHRGVGVLWSNQTGGAEGFYFAAHTDGAGDATWETRETVDSGVGSADGHISLKTETSTGRIIAAVKTNKVAGTDPLIEVLARTGDSDAAGSWSIHPVSSENQHGSRPVLVLDSENSEANVFITDLDNPQIIYRRVAPLSSLNFGTQSIGTAFISNAATATINNGTSTKQMTDVTTGVVVLAADIPTRTYFHGCTGGPCPTTPVADFTGTPTSGVAPLSVQFTDASTGNIATWAWTFGDGGTSTLQNPIHSYNPGTYDVSLTVTNVAGTNAKTRTGYIVVSVPPGSTFKAMMPPERVLDTRVGIGLSGVFKANEARDFQVTNGGTIPTGAAAVTGNLTVTQQTKAGYVVLAPSPGGTTSTINFPAGDNRANGVTVALSGSGQLNAVYKAPPGAHTQLLFDVTGYFENGAGGAKFHSVIPERVLDTRFGTGLSGVFHANTARDFQVTNGGTIPTGAAAVTGNITVTQQTKGGYVVLAPAAGGTTSTINFPVGDNRANGVTVPLSGSGSLNAVYKGPSGATTHLLFDVTGYFMSGSGGFAWFPLAPQRVLDTRFGTGLSGPFHANTARDFPVTNGASGTIPDTAQAVTGNITVTQQTKGGYIVLAPAAGGTTSTINFPVGDNRANGVTVPLAVGTPGTLNAVYKGPSGATTAILFDVTGYFK